jgi:magnesium transporter
MQLSTLLESRSEQVRCIASYDKTGKRTDLSLDEISDALALNDGSIIWVGLFEPDEPLLFKMQIEFDLHPLSIEDAHKAHQRPKIERFGNCLFIVVNTAQITDEHIVFGETHIFIGVDFLLTVRHGGSHTYGPARERFERNSEYLQLGTGMALYTLLDLIVDNYFPIVSKYEKILDDLEESILNAEFQRDTIIRLYKLRGDLTKLRLAVSPMQDNLSTLMTYHNDIIKEDVRVYLRDVHDHVVRLNESIDTMRETISSAMTTNLSLVTVSQGDTMKRLAGWAALLAAPTLITSWYGMNFETMPELHFTYSYGILFVVVATICLSLFLALKRAKWL